MTKTEVTEALRGLIEILECEDRLEGLDLGPVSLLVHIGSTWNDNKISVQLRRLPSEVWPGFEVSRYPVDGGEHEKIELTSSMGTLEAYAAVREGAA